MTRSISRARCLILLAIPALATVACSERDTVTQPQGSRRVEQGPTRQSVTAALTCEARVHEPRLSCGPVTGLTGNDLGPQFLIVGGQNVFVRLESPVVSYDADTETFSASVQVSNVGVGQTLGTPDGFSMTGVRVFFHMGPNVTIGSGEVTVANEDGSADFTGMNQPYFQYDTRLAPPGGIDPSTSSLKTWQWNVPTTVETFVFEVFVDADVRHPNGFVELTPGAFAASIGGMQQLGAVVRDVVGREVTGRVVTYSDPDPSIATVTASGLVTAQGYGVGSIIGSSDGPEADGVARVTVPAPGWNVESRVFGDGGGLPAAVQTAIDDGLTRWESVITGDLPLVEIDTETLACGQALHEVVDDVLLFAYTAPIDGALNTLAQAGPCLVRVESGNVTTPLVGILGLDSDDLEFMETNGILDDVVLHEMGHVWGVGALWEAHSLLFDDAGQLTIDDCVASPPSDPYFNGSQAIAAFNSVGGGSYTGNKVPVEDTGGEGTICGHWRESVMDNELMTGIADLTNPLSLVTVRSLDDLGYTVDPTQADPYTLPAPTAAAREAITRIPLGHDIRRGPIYTVGPGGRVRRVR